MEQVNKLKQDTNYSEAINIMEETKKFYSDDRDFLDLLTEVKKLQQTKESEEKERKKVEEIKSAIDEVMNKFHKISEQMYQQAQAEQAQGGAQEETKQDDNVVDADFEVKDDK